MSTRKVFCPCGKIIEEGSKCSCKQAAKRDYMREYQRNDKDNPLKTTRWNKLRKEILKQDKFLCQRCLLKYGSINSSDLQAHHIKSRRDFPELVFVKDNIITMCGTCNRQLGTKNKLDFKRTIIEEANTDFFN